MATLVYSDVDGVDRSFALGAEPITVGRSAECAIRSDDPRVSRVHARLFVEQGALWVEDLGSSNGVFVGPDRVQCAPVPAGEIILIGSLVIRLLPGSGALPPPIGVHGTLASWLDLERKARAAIAEERDAFARRVGEMHHQLSAVMSARAIDPEAPNLACARDEAEARAAALERALAAVQDELALAHARIAEVTAEISERVEWAGDTSETAGSAQLAAEITRLAGALEDAERGQSIAEHAHGEAMREAQIARDELVSYQRASAAELEAARALLDKAREAAESAAREAARRADDAAARASAADAMARDAAEALRRAEQAEAQARGITRELEQRAAAAAEAPVTELARALTARAEPAQSELAGKLDEAVRELAAERTAALALVDRKTQLEHELAAAHAQLPALQQRAEAAEHELAEAEAQRDGLRDGLRDRVGELERDLAAAAAAEAAGKSSASELRVALGAHETAAQDARAAAAAAEGMAEQLRSRRVELEGRLRASDDARAAAEAALGDAQAHIDELERAAAERAALSEQERDRLAAAVAHAEDAERKIDVLTARTEAADLAIGHAGALQRQLDEALTRLAWLEREQASGGQARPPSGPSGAEAADQIAEDEARVRDAEARARDAEARARDAEARARDAEARAQDAETWRRDAEARVVDAEHRAEERLRRAAIEVADRDGERTRTGSPLPIAAIAEHVTTLEESIDSLRASMRAASDETATMAPSHSVDTISSAVSQAAEHVEVARAAIRALAASIGSS